MDVYRYKFCSCDTGKKSKSASVSIDHDLAEGLVDLDKLKTNMESTVSKLQLDFRDKISTKILPSEYIHSYMYHIVNFALFLSFPLTL